MNTNQKLLPSQKPFFGKVLFNLGVFLTLLAMITGFLIYGASEVFSFGLYLVPVGLIVSAAFFIRRSRRHMAKCCVDVLKSSALRKDRRAPALYLRSFSEDGNATSFALRSLMFTFGRTLRRIMLLIFTFRLSYEQVLAFAFRKLGPVIAIGKPEERLPELGSLREYVEEDRWKERVTELAAKSRLVVIQIGTSDGLI